MRQYYQKTGIAAKGDNLYKHNVNVLTHSNGDMGSQFTNFECCLYYNIAPQVLQSNLCFNVFMGLFYGLWEANILR